MPPTSCRSVGTQVRTSAAERHRAVVIAESQSADDIRLASYIRRTGKLSWRSTAEVHDITGRASVETIDGFDKYLHETAKAGSPKSKNAVESAAW